MPGLPPEKATGMQAGDEWLGETQAYDNDTVQAAMPGLPPEKAAGMQAGDEWLGETQAYDNDTVQAAMPGVAPTKAAGMEAEGGWLGETQAYGNDTFQAAMPRLPPEKAAEMEAEDGWLGETQAYGNDTFQAAMPGVPPPSMVSGTEQEDGFLAETQPYGNDTFQVPVSPVVPPTKLGKQRAYQQTSGTEEVPTSAAETPQKLKIPVFLVSPVATPARSLSKPPGLQQHSQHSAACPSGPCSLGSETVQPEVSPQLAKRRRLTGKQQPPVPNPWSATTSQRSVRSNALGDAASARAAHSTATTSLGEAGSRPPCSTRRSPIVRTIRPQPCFTTTGIDLSKRIRRFLEVTLRARVVDTWSPDVTHLVCDTFRRTTKMMCAICVGARIVTPAYVDACRVAGRLVDEAPYMLRDKVSEAAFARRNGLQAYSVESAIERAGASGPLLAGFSVYCAPSVLGRHELQVLVESAGGKWLRRCPSSRQHDGQQQQQQQQQQGLQKLLLLGKDFDAELVREAACTQCLRFDAHRLSRPVSTAPAPT